MLYGAWLSDDYLIGLRQTLNLIHGRGFSFYSDARVQTMTSPLWGLVLAPVVAAGDSFYAPMLFSVLLSLGAVWITFRPYWAIPANRTAALILLGVLTCSRAFIDFTTSGLENPLAYLIAAGLLAALRQLHSAPTSSSFAKVCGFSAALCLTRYEYGLIVLPTLLSWSWRLRRQRVLIGLGVFVAIVLPWLAFALVYYGTIFPNTFYAKLTTAIPLHDSVVFGLRYYEAMIKHDPQTLMVMALAIALALSGREWREWLPLCVGLIGFLAFVIVAGGDFMIGRFVSVPLFLSAGLLCESICGLSGRNRVYTELAVAVGLLAATPRLPIFDNYLSPESMKRAGRQTAEILPRINDEKNAYLYSSGLFTGHLHFAGWLKARVDRWQTSPNSEPRRAVLVDCGGMGWLNMDYGPDAKVFDLCALADPFLSKLPLYQIGADRQLLGWGPGHFTRAEPPGYTATLASGVNSISDPVLAKIYDEVERITTGPLFTRERWAAIYHLATLDLIEMARAAPSYRGMTPARPQETYVARYAEYSSSFRTQCTPTHLADRMRPADHLELFSSTAAHSPAFRISGTPGETFRLKFLSRATDVGQLDVQIPRYCDYGLGLAEGAIPPTALSSGFDQVSISRSATTDQVVFGGLILNEFNFEPARSFKGELVFGKEACELPTKGGESTAECSILGRSGRQQPGYLTYGPYQALSAGLYVFEFAYRSAAVRGAAAGEWDVVLRSGEAEQYLARGEIAGTSGERGIIGGHFSVAPGIRNSVVEVRTAPDATVETELFQLNIYRGD
jgi:arabinofuranosyltransferase